MEKIVKIIPFIKLPRRMDFFDYLISEKQSKTIKIGSLIEVPFRKKTIKGIVAEITDHSDFDNLKPIVGVISTVPYLSKTQIQLAHWFSDYYYYSLASTIKLFIAEQP